MAYLHKTAMGVCDYLLHDLTDFIPLLEDISALINKVVIEEHAKSDARDAELLKPFPNIWKDHKPYFEQAWAKIDQNCKVSDAFCTVSEHCCPETSGYCRFKPGEPSDTFDEVHNRVNHQLFAQVLPDISTTADLWEENNFRKYWIFIVWNIVLLLEERLTVLRLDPTEGTKSFFENWKRSASIIQLIWSYARETEEFKLPVRHVCYYHPESSAESAMMPCQSHTASGMLSSFGVISVSHTNGDASTEHLVEEKVVMTKEKFRQIGHEYETFKKQVEHYKKILEEEEKKTSELTIENKTLSSEKNTAYKKVEQINCDLANEVSEKRLIQQEYKVLQDEHSSLLDSTRQHEQQQAKVFQRLDEQVASLTQQLQKYKENAEQMKSDKRNLESENDELRKVKSDLLDRLSSAMNQQMARDESDLENINVKNRPMKIMEEYHMFCSQEWLEAKTALDDWMLQEIKGDMIQEKDLCDFARNAIMICCDFAEKSFSSVLHVLGNPIQPQLLGMWTEDFKDIPRAGHMDIIEEDMKLQIAKFYKDKSDNMDFTDVAQVLLRNHLSVSFGYKSISFDRSQKLLEYFQKCLVLCWKMVLQQPPMSFKCTPSTGGRFDECQHEPHFGSADPADTNAIIHYYIHPGLYHGEKLMKKAKVVLHIDT